MTVSMFITMLAIFSGLTGLVVEAEKKILDEIKRSCPPNLLALATACVIGWVGTSYIYLINLIPWTAQNVLALVLMGFASGLCAMVGYDKVVQLFGQMKG